MQRAFSNFQIKSIDEERRLLYGVASTPGVDRQGDIVDPKGAVFTLPIPFLWQHNQADPIGEVVQAELTDEGIAVGIQMAQDDEPGPFKDLVDKAWSAIKKRVVRGLSVGILPIDPPRVHKSGRGLKISKWHWVELSAVTVPANVECTIQLIKSLDSEYAAASGIADSVPVPASAGRVVKVIKRQPGTGKMAAIEYPIAIKDYENTRAAKQARLDEIMKKSAEDGVTLDQEQEEEYDTLETEIKAIDKHLVRLRDAEKVQKTAAVPVNGNGTESAAKSREGLRVVSVGTPHIEKGIGFARYAAALLNHRGNRYEAAQFAEQRWPDQPEVATMLKAAVAAGSTTDATWAGPLVKPTNLAAEFLELLRPATLLGRIPGLRVVPFNTDVPAQTGGGTYSWVGQGVGKPVSAAAFATVSLPFAKASGIIVLTKELVKLSAPSAERVIRDEMIAGMATYLDTQFTDPAVAVVANVSPASITNGVTGFAATGTAEANARADLRTLIKSFQTNNFGLSGVVLLMSEANAFVLGTMVNAVGQPAFPGISATGGSIIGIPVITSNVVGATQIVAAHAPSILIADDGTVEIDMSDQATVQMDSVPDNPTTSATVMVSLWQRNLVGLRADRFATWKVARTSAVNRITSVAYA